jgi:hypothetical protein
MTTVLGCETQLHHAKELSVVGDTLSKIDEELKFEESTTECQHEISQILRVQAFSKKYKSGEIRSWRIFCPFDDLCVVPFCIGNIQQLVVGWKLDVENKFWFHDGIYETLEQVLISFSKDSQKIATQIPSFISCLIYQMLTIFALFEKEQYFYYTELKDFWVDSDGKIKFSGIQTGREFDKHPVSRKDVMVFFGHAFYDLIFKAIKILVPSFEQQMEFWKIESREMDGFTVAFLLTLRTYIETSFKKRFYGPYKAEISEFLSAQEFMLGFFLHSFAKIDSKVPVETELIKQMRLIDIHYDYMKKFPEPESVDFFAKMTGPFEKKFRQYLPKSLSDKIKTGYEKTVTELEDRKVKYGEIIGQLEKIPSTHKIKVMFDPWRRMPETQIYCILEFGCLGHVVKSDYIKMMGDYPSIDVCKAQPKEVWCEHCKLYAEKIGWCGDKE